MIHPGAISFALGLVGFLLAAPTAAQAESSPARPVIFHVKTALSVDDAQICVVPNVAELPDRERLALAEQFGVPLEEVPQDYGAYLRFIKEKSAKIYYNTTMALLYEIDPGRIDDALEPLELEPLLQVLTADADYLVY